MASNLAICNCCGSDVTDHYFWRCDVCRGKLCGTCEEEQEASNHALVGDDEDAHNPDCPFCTYAKPVVRASRDFELVELLEYACGRLGITYSDLYDDCFSSGEADDDDAGPAGRDRLQTDDDEPDGLAGRDA